MKIKRKSKPPKPYRSWFEYDFHKKFKSLEYETHRVSYISKHVYTPDFCSGNGKYLIECKGRFRDSKEARKYLDIRESLTDQEIVFVVMNPKTYMPNAKRRKDGTKATMKEWFERHGFQYATPLTIPKEWIT